MDTAYWSIVFKGNNVNVLHNKNGYYIVDKNLYVVFINGKSLGPYESLKNALGVIKSLELEG